MRRHERGLTTVEFAFVGAILVVLLFSVVEFGRLLFSYAVLNEGMRRSARLAAVCPIGSPGIINAATGFANLPGFNAGNVQVSYLDTNGDTTANYPAINYVQVQVVNYSIQLLIPFFPLTINTPSFAVTLPRESLGVSPTDVGFCG
jgi:Flp pilus assembly protein TadG